MEYVIELINVVKDYGDFRLGPVSFAIPKGCVCGFIGQNGAGKTTTIRLLLDAISPDSGNIRLFGKDISSRSVSLREHIGVVFDEMGFHEFMTARDINRMLKNIYHNWNETDFFSYLTRFSLPTRKPCGTFSRGMRMKLQIATALSHNASLLIMDEPTSGLDPIVRNEILQIFREFVLEEDHTILISSHITSDLERLADEIIFIDGGQIILKGNKDEILDTHGLLKCRRDEIAGIDRSLLIGSQQSSFGAEILVNDRRKASRLLPDMIIEPASLEDIMIYYLSSLPHSTETPMSTGHKTGQSIKKGDLL